MVTDDREFSIAEYEKEIERLEKSLEHIRQAQFTIDAAVNRVQSRSLADILRARMRKHLNKQSEELWKIRQRRKI